MHKHEVNKILILWSVVLGIGLLSANVSAVERNGYSNQNLNLPLEQLTQGGKQQTKNKNNQLFQSDKVGDIQKERARLEKHGRKQVFQKDSKPLDLYSQKDVFKKKVKSAKVKVDYTAQKKHQSKIQFSYWYVILGGILIGSIGSYLLMKGDKKNERRNSNHDCSIK